MWWEIFLIRVYQLPQMIGSPKNSTFTFVIKVEEILCSILGRFSHMKWSRKYWIGKDKALKINKIWSSIRLHLTDKTEPISDECVGLKLVHWTVFRDPPATTHFLLVIERNSPPPFPPHHPQKPADFYSDLHSSRLATPPKLRICKLASERVSNTNKRV